ncbi:MAG: right-handed parallel beta-helix repeat-containing protein [Candidatus Heimdallarchaeota archaeon]|nr:right-handed parallel beta-helix repeat-containing protein [Candidatus Heimdallarchaeota archaeon]
MVIEEENNIIKDNVFYGNASALRISGITNSTIENNVLHNAGFHIYDDDIVNISNNTYNNNIVNGKQFGFILNRTSETISGNQYGQIYLANSIDTNIEGYTIDEVNMGVQVQNCTNILIENVVISGRSGIEIINTQGIQIENCILNGYGKGIAFDTVTDSIVQNNHITNYSYGLEYNFADRVQINNNSILEATDMGIYFEDNWNIIITFNIISSVVQSAGTEIAINVGSCENVSVYYNVFISLGELMAQPAEEWSCINIMWYNDTLEVGNYYSDWNGMGTYPLTGNVGSDDLYPFIDIDEDNLNEFDEVTVYFTDPFTADSDSDGLDDGEEVNTYNTDPLSVDSDSDGMDDYWEVTYGTDPNTDDANEDPDEDGLTNIEEYTHNTLPTNNDTDSDGYLDGEEVEAGTDPLNSSSYPIIADPSNLWLIVGISVGAGVIIGVSAYILIRKRKVKPTSTKKKK